MQVENWFDFDTNPLYAIMHESIYCQVFNLTNSVFCSFDFVKMDIHLKLQFVSNISLRFPEEEA
jgi:hypothetical protein